MIMEDYNLLQLAYIGDAVYELFIREYLINKNIVKTKDLRDLSLRFVSATSQAEILKRLQDNNFLTEEENEIIRKGRNTKVHSKPRNTDIITYKLATALEVLIGNLYLNNKNRLYEILNEIIKIKEGMEKC